MLKIIEGDDIAIPVTLKKNGSVVAINLQANVKAAIISPSHSELLSSVVDVDSGTAGSDWPNGLIIVVMTAAQTATIRNGMAMFEIEVDDGGKTTWFTEQFKIVPGLIS